MNWRILGSTGLLGTELLSALSRAHQTYDGLRGRELEQILDQKFSSASDIWNLQDESHFWVYSLGFTDVDAAEMQSKDARLMNSTLPERLATKVSVQGGTVIYISTDYVFDGSSNTPYKTTDTPNPQSAYGRSKLAGEVAVQESGADYQIFRTAWLYGANGNCFPKTVARVLKEQGQMKVVADQIGQPTWTRDLAELLIAHQDIEVSARPRIVHATASGSCSWYEFALEIALSLGYDPNEVIIPIKTAEYPTPAKRPAYSVLDNVNETGLIIGNWRERWKEAAPLVLAEYL